MKELPINKKTKQWLLVGLQVMIVLFAMAIGYFGHRFIPSHQGNDELLLQAKQILIENTIQELPSAETLQHGMIRGMLETLQDPYTYFVEPSAHEVETGEINGSFGGIGVRVERDTDLNWRLYPLQDSPAFHVGVKDGDILIGVDDLVITKETNDITLIAAVRGPVGEVVKIIVQRESETFNFTIEREDVPLPTVQWNLVADFEKIGMIKVSRISETTADEVTTAIEDLLDQGAKSFILDLRNNGGGLVETGVAIANLFLEQGEILHQKFNNDKEEIFKVEEPGAYTNFPLVILVNENTASSAEIVAGAIKKHDRAPIIGSQTFGKTCIQYIFDLEDGSSIHITSGEWWIPGVTFPLQPDYPVMDDGTGVAELQKAIEVLGEE